jgi:hypothetical protein
MTIEPSKENRMSQDAPAPVERPKPPFRRVVVFVGRDS